MLTALDVSKNLGHYTPCFLLKSKPPKPSKQRDVGSGVTMPETSVANVPLFFKEEEFSTIILKYVIVLLRSKSDSSSVVVYGFTPKL